MRRISIKIHDKIDRFREEKDIDVFQMPKQEFVKWVKYLERQEEEENKK